MEATNQSILHEYPYPIAKCYEKVMGARDAMERWEKLRQLFEATLKYCACFAIAEYLHTQHDDQKINSALSYLSKPTMGHWFNLFRLCSKHSIEAGKSFLPETVFDKIRNRPGLIAAFNKIRNYLESGKYSQSESVGLLSFLELWVTYRNRTSGHGAPQRDHMEEFNSCLETGVTELLLHLDVLKRAALVYLAEIRVERQSFVHILYRLMGTSKIAIQDHMTSKENALLGLDKNLLICIPETEKPVLSVHPLMIFFQDDVYILQSSDLKHNVDYICHHTGVFYSADRIYEDFKEKLGTFFGNQIIDQGIDREEIYSNAIRMSLLDGIIEQEERDALDNMRSQLELSELRARELEGIVFSKMEARADRTEPRRTISITEATPATALPATEPGIVKHKSPNILFFPYASVRLGFWAELVSLMAAHAFKNNMVFSMVAPDPSSDYDSASMTALLADAGTILRMYRPDLIIMVPSPSQAFMGLFQKKFPEFGVPLMTVDTEFCSYDFFKENRLPLPPIVQVDNYEGGQLAAHILSQDLPDDSHGPRFLLMPGLDDAPHSLARVKGFEDSVRSRFPEARIKHLPAGSFQRHKAKKIMDNFCEDADLSKYLGIFCCNDEMALGVHASLCQHFQGNLSFGIVGFNDTLEMQHSIMTDKRGWLKGTISQNFPDYVKTILQVANKLLQRQAVEPRYLIKPIAISATDRA